MKVFFKKFLKPKRQQRNTYLKKTKKMLAITEANKALNNIDQADAFLVTFGLLAHHNKKS